MNAKYTKTAGVLVAAGLFVLTLTNATTVFSQASELTSLTSVFKKVSELELLAAASQPAATLTAEQLAQNKLTSLKKTLYPNVLALTDAQITNLLNQFLNTDEARANEAVYLAVAFANFPDKEQLVIAAAEGADFQTAAGEITSNQFSTNDAQSAFNASSGGSVLIPTVSPTT